MLLRAAASRRYGTALPQSRVPSHYQFRAKVVPPVVSRLRNMDFGNAQTRGAGIYEKRAKNTFQTRWLMTTPVYSTEDIKFFFDRCASSTGFAEPHGDPQRLLEYRLNLVRKHARLRPDDVVLDLGCGNGHHLLALAPEMAQGIGIDFSPAMIRVARDRLRRSSAPKRLTFEVDDAEELKGTADRSVDLVICIGAFEHMVNKRRVLANVYRVLKHGGRFFCLSVDADYVWYRTLAPLLGFATKHLSSDKFLTSDEFVGLLGRAGFGRIESFPWTFIPRGDMPRIVGLLLAGLDAIGRRARLRPLRGGLCVCAWKTVFKETLQ
jgi:cyclopropane fatty-acyl-phospholipid synthase-like methyltransferase